MSLVVLFLQSDDQQLSLLSVDLVQNMLVSVTAVNALCAVRRFAKALVELMDSSGDDVICLAPCTFLIGHSQRVTCSALCCSSSTGSVLERTSNCV